mgnify:CR=1 FL=1
MRVKPKKHLGQHFLKDESVCASIAESITRPLDCENILEIGPGTGALTKHILSSDPFRRYYVMEVDTESINYLGIFIILQIILGIFTVLYGAQIYVASMHQISSIFLVSSSIYFFYLNTKFN